MTSVLTPAPPQEHFGPEYAAPMPESLDPMSREVLDLALVAIDGMQQLPEADQAAEEGEVRALLDTLDADEQKRADLHQWLQAAAGTGQMRYNVLARLMGVPEVESDERLSGEEITQRLETQGYVKEAPDFDDQLEDESREKVPLVYDKQSFSDPKTERGRRRYRTTELQGLRELSGYLREFLSRSTQYAGEAGFGIARGSAKSMLKNLTYMGGEEVDEGADGFAQDWQSYLEQNSDNLLCIITTSALRGGPDKQRTGGSDDFIRDKILATMVKNGAPASLMDRVITSINDPRLRNGDPRRVKKVAVDDWVASGRQMREKIRLFRSLARGRFGTDLEVNVLAAPPQYVQDGFDVDGVAVPLKTYYRAHRADPADSDEVGAHITGTHATLNFGVALQLERMQALQKLVRTRGQAPMALPAVASVYREYWD